MKKENYDKIRSDFESCVKKIKDYEPYINDDEAMAVLYNQAIVDKAVLAHKISMMYSKKNFFDDVKKTFVFVRRKKQICDYFVK